MIVIEILLAVAALYLAAGLLFALLFITKGLTQVDPAAKGSGWSFRLIILPGTVLLWPVLFNKWRQIKKTPHEQTPA